jgi:hypothetical protein
MVYRNPGIPPHDIRRWSKWIDTSDRVTRYLVTERSPAGAEQVPVRVIADRTHPAAGLVFSMRRGDFGVRLRQVNG